MSAPAIIYSERALDYRDPGHPESPERVRLAAGFLIKKGYALVRPEPASEADLLRVHSQDLVRRVRLGQFFESDTPNLPGIYDFARLAAGGADKAAALATVDRPAFSLLRPPGHHAGRNKLGGFCYFNNIAIAAEKIRSAGRKVAILDIDAHHGNGTQDIFFGQESVIYVSLHRAGIYPSTGYRSEANCYNFPFAEIPSPEKYLETLARAVSLINEFEPDMAGVSAGFDTYRHDLLGGLGLGIGHYLAIGREIARLGCPVFAVLEGGYSDRLGECVMNFLGGWEAE